LREDKYYLKIRMRFKTSKKIIILEINPISMVTINLPNGYNHNSVTDTTVTTASSTVQSLH
jgi:hypothetical protein